MDSEPTDAPAAAYPGWVMLNHSVHGRSYCFPADDASNTTVASCLTSAGKRIQATFRLVAPPGNSALFLDLPDVRNHDELDSTEVIAAHGDSVLIRARDCSSNLGFSAQFEYFVYRAGAGAKPPSMSPLPPCYLPMPWNRGSSRRRPEPEARFMDSTDTGLLRRGEDELAVAQLSVSASTSPELCVLRSGRLRLEWETKRPLVVYAEGATGNELQQWRGWDAVVPIGDRFLCWVDYYRGLLLCDVFDDSDEPVLRYVPLPVEPNQGLPQYRDAEGPFKQARNVGITAGGAAVRFVSVDRRCCCGGLLESSCPRSRFSFTLTAWTLDMDSMTWSSDGVLLRSDELWALPAYEGLPRVTPEFPVLCMDDADAVCLMVHHYGLDAAADGRIWIIKVDTRSKTLLSVVRYTSARYKPVEDDDNDYRRQINEGSKDNFDGIGFIPSQVSGKHAARSLL